MLARAVTHSSGGFTVTLPTLPNLDGLIGLARQDGVDIRPTLVRVLTDLYVHKHVHSREEEHRYTELALCLLAAVDVPTRGAVAKKLATYVHAPRLVVRRLARDVFEVAEPVLKYSPCLTSEDLLMIIGDFGPRYAAAIGERNRCEPPPAADADDVDDETPPEAVAEPSDLATAGARADPVESPRVPLGEYFLDAGVPERRMLLANLEDGTLTASEQSFAARTDDAVRRLEAAALQRRPDEFVRGLERELRIPEETALRIVHDETGEPIVVAAKALAVPSDALLRILLFLNPVIGHSVERVFDLVNLHDQLSMEAALHLVASWQKTQASEKRTARHQPLHWDDEARGARRTFAEHPRRFPLQVPDGRGHAARTESLPARRAQRTS
jgi:hypothetical protein